VNLLGHLRELTKCSITQATGGVWSSGCEVQEQQPFLRRRVAQDAAGSSTVREERRCTPCEQPALGGTRTAAPEAKTDGLPLDLNVSTISSISPAAAATEIIPSVQLGDAAQKSPDSEVMCSGLLNPGLPIPSPAQAFYCLFKDFRVRLQGTHLAGLPFL
jgi:hypothetical protein